MPGCRHRSRYCHAPVTSRDEGRLPEEAKELKMRSLLLALSAVLAGLALGACGGSKSSSSTVASPPRSATATATSPTTTTVTRTVPAPPAQAATCRAATLALSYLGQQGAAGHGEIGFALKNIGTATCHTSGFPGILWLDRAGHALPTVPQHVTSDMAGSVPVVALNVSPGQSVSFRLFVTHGAVPGLPCTTAYGLQVIPPNDTASLRIAIPNGAYECRTATVSPIASGTSAYP